MDFNIKYDCYDMSVLLEGLLGIDRKLNNLFEDYEVICNQLNDLIKNDIDFKKIIDSDLPNRVKNECDLLSETIEIYLSVDRKIRDSVYNIKDISVKNNKMKKNEFTIEKSAINNRDLILEEWLYDLIYKQKME